MNLARSTSDRFAIDLHQFVDDGRVAALDSVQSVDVDLLHNWNGCGQVVSRSR